MKKISFLLIFCFLFQGCVSSISNSIALGAGRITQKLGRNKECSFLEVLLQRTEDKLRLYASLIIFFTVPTDLAIAINHYLTVHPIGLELFATGMYAWGALILLTETLGLNHVVKKKYIEFDGWNHQFAAECKEDYFIHVYESEMLFPKEDTEFVKELLSYPNFYDLSLDEKINNFRNDFLRKYKIETFGKSYRYIYYPGGKAKFEEDFGKYLYTNRQK